MTRVRGRAARAGLYAGAYLGPFGGGVTTAMLPELGASFGVSAGEATSTLTAYLLPFAALMLVSGTLGERWGRRRTVVAAYVVYAVSSIGSVLAPTLPLFLLARAVQGGANAFTTPLLLAALGASVDRRRLGRALGWFGSLQSAGMTSAPLVGGLAAELDWRWAFAGVAAVAAVLALLGIPEGAHARDRPRLGVALRSALRPEMLRLGVVAAVGWGCMSGLAFLVVLRLEIAFGLGAGARGLLLTGAGVAGILSARLVGGGVDRFGGRRCVLVGAALGAGLVLGAGIVPSPGAVAVLWAAVGVTSQLVLVGVNALTLGSSGGNRGGSMSVVQAVRFGGGAISPVVFTPLFDTYPLAGFAVPALLLVMAVPPALPSGEPRVSRPGASG